MSGDELMLDEVKASRTATGYGPVISLSMQCAFHVAAVLFHVAAVLFHVAAVIVIVCFYSSYFRA